MKRFLATNTRFFLFAALIAIISVVSCKKDETKPNTDTLTKNGIALTGSQEVPAVSTSGSGTVDVTYTKSTKMLMFTAKWSGLTTPATAMHFHGPADPGTSVGVIVPINNFTPGTSGTVSGMVTLDEVKQKEAELLAGKWYYNIHTSTNPGGEIRGQIVF